MSVGAPLELSVRLAEESRSLLDRRLALPIAWGCSLAVALGLSLARLWAQPLNVDEEVTLSVAQQAPLDIVTEVWGERGGAPLHFLLVHGALVWPGGLEALRLPSLVFFLLALPAVGLVGRELCGRTEGLLVVPLVALAPLAAGYATFGRPHTLFLASFLWFSWIALRAARLGGRTRWALAGVLLGALVYVHPTAPLYAGVSLVAALVHARQRPRRLLGDAWPAALAFALITLPYFLEALDVLRERYGVRAGAPRGRTFFGNSVPKEALDALAAGSFAVGLPIGVLAVAGFAFLLRKRPRTALILGLIVGVPILFFAYVPAGARSGVFFGRYMLPALPAFLLLVLAGAKAIARVRGGVVVAALALVALVGLEAYDNASRLRAVRTLELPRLVSAVAPYREGSVLFDATGTIAERGTIRELTAGRPPRLLDDYVGLEVQALPAVADSECAGVRTFLASKSEPRRGLWLFYRAARRELPAARALLGRVPGAEAELVAATYLLVRSRNPLPSRGLVELGIRLRERWSVHVPNDPSAPALLAAARAALGTADC